MSVCVGVGVCVGGLYGECTREREGEGEREILTNFNQFVDVRRTIMTSDCSVCNPFPSPVCPAVETGVCGSNPDSGPNSPPSSAHGSLANGSLSSLHSKEVRLSCDLSVCLSLPVSFLYSKEVLSLPVSFLYSKEVRLSVCLFLCVAPSPPCTLERYIC